MIAYTIAIAMMAGPNVGLSRKPTKMSAAMTSAMTAPGMPQGLTYGRSTFGNFLRRMMNDTSCSP